MKVYKETVLALLDTQLGYCEKKTNDSLYEWSTNFGSGNYTKYAAELDEIGYWNTGKSKKNGYEWCAPFVNWIFWVASGRNVEKTKEALCIPKDEENLAAGCEYIRKYFRDAGRFNAKPEIGALVIFTTTANGGDSADHIGIVTDISDDGKTIYTIEGNKDNQVSACLYPVGYWKILGYCHPKYDVPDCDDADQLRDDNKRYQSMISTIKEVIEKW